MAIRDGTVRTFCGICLKGCGLLVTVEGGKVTRVKGDPENPLNRRLPCAKGFALPEILNHPDRLKYPLKREGEKGKGNWVRISWDEALTTIANKLKIFKEEFGAQTVAFGLGDPKGLFSAFSQRLASVFGTPNVATTGHVCHLPRDMASIFTLGSQSLGDYDYPPGCIVVWGSNSIDTHLEGITREQLRFALENGVKLIVIDPIKTRLASQADIWIKVRPSSDGALALAMIKAIIDGELYDKEFIGNWTVGFDKLREHVKYYSPSKAEEITWVPQQQIVDAARLYACTKPAVIQGGNALEHNISSFQTCRAISILRAITGNIDIPGGEILLSRLPLTSPSRFMLLPEFPRKNNNGLGMEFNLAFMSANIPRQLVVNAILEEKPYPVKALLLFGSNPLLSYADANRTYNALMKLEFLVVSDLFMTPTAELADIVLPAATSTEFDELAPYPIPSSSVVAHPKIVEPPGECWSDIKIINELAKKLDLAEYFWADEKEALNLILKPSGLTFEELKEKRGLQASKEYKKYKKNGFRTPSGKVELYSRQLQKMGYSPLPVYNESPRTPFNSPVPAWQFPLVLTSAKSASFYHSAYRNIPTLRKMSPEPVAQLNPDTANELGMEEGVWVYIETEKGRIKQKLLLNSDLDPRVVVASYGWWFPERGKEGLYGWNESNINILTESAPPYEPSVGSVTLRGMVCKVSKV